MKKIISFILVAILCLGALTSCDMIGKVIGGVLGGSSSESTDGLESAKSYVSSKYSKDSSTPNEDYDLISKITINKKVYEITWTTDLDTIKIKASAKEGYVTVDLPDANGAAVAYVLTATIQDTAGKSTTVSFNRTLPVIGTANPPAGGDNPPAGGDTECQHQWNEGVVTTQPTCSAAGVKTFTCTVAGCGETKTEPVSATGNHNFQNGECTVCHTPDPDYEAPANSANLSFESADNRVSLDVDTQVWKQNGITFTNEKSASTSNVADFVNPVRCYLGSSIKITYTSSISKIVFNCGTYQDKDYPAALVASIGEQSGVSVSVDGTVVTVEFAQAVSSFTVSSLTAQVRLNSITVVAGGTTNPPAGGDNPPAGGDTECQHQWDEGVVTTQPTCGAAGVKTFTCTVAGCGETKTEPVSATGNHNFQDGECTVCHTPDPDYEAPEEDPISENYTYTFTESQFTGNGEAVLGGVKWNLAGDGGYWEYDATKGQHLGSGKKPYKSLTFTSQAFSGVTKVVINTSGGSNVNATLTVFVGDTQMGEAVSITAEPATYTFTSATPLNGEIKFSYTQTSSKAIYIKEISVECLNGEVTPPAGGDTECQHQWNEGEVTTAPTCSVVGVKTFTCTVDGCGETKTEPVPTVDHAWDNGTVTTEPTCGTAGVKTFTCTFNCGETTTEPVSATGNHNFQDGECSVCHTPDPDYQPPAGGDNPPAGGDTECQHQWNEGEVTTAPTCSVAGVKTFTCTVAGCGETKTEPVPTVDHAWDNGTVTTEPTCGTAGVKTFTCTFNCGETTTKPVAATGNHDFQNGECSVCHTPDPDYEAPEEDPISENYTYTFTESQFTDNGEAVLAGVKWNLAGDGGYWDYNATKGQHLGSGNKPYKSLTFTSQAFAGVTKVVINTSGGSKVNATLTVFVGDTQMGEAVSITAEPATYTFTSATPLNGEIKFSYTQTSSKAIYIKEISVECLNGEVTPPAGGDNPPAGGDNPPAGDGEEVTPPASNSFNKATSVTVGDIVTLVNEDAKMELSEISTTNTKYGIGVSCSDSVSGAYALTIVAGSSDGTFAFKTADGTYLCWTSGNTLNVSETVDANSSWTITFDVDGNVVIKNVTDSARQIQWNSSSPRFAAYTSTQTAIQLYKQG